MKKIYKLYFLIFLFAPLSVFSQITYTFDAGGNGYTSDAGATYTNMIPYGTTTLATMETKTLSALAAPAGADGNTSLVFHGLTKLSGINTMSVDLTAFAGSNDQQVIWKTYLKSAVATRAGVILRAQSTVSGYATGLRQGYYFSVVGTTTSGQVSYRIGKFNSTSAIVDLKAATNTTIAGFTTGPLYLRAKAVGSTLTLEYSTDGSTYTQFSGASVTDASFTSGTVQLTYGLGGGSVLDQYVDDVTITDLSVPKISITGFDKYIFTGSNQGPATANTTNFTGIPTLTYSYKGIGATSYNEVDLQPVAPGQYIAIANATSGSQTAKDTLAYEILPTQYTKYYTFNSDTKGAIAANTYYKTAANHLVQAGLGYFFSTSGTNSYKSTGNMLQSTGNAMTTLAAFGETDSIAADYQVIWKDYASATGQKRGVILRAAGTNSFMRVFGNTTNVGKGYLFYVNNFNANSLQLDIRKLQSDTITYKKASILTSDTVQYNGINTATWYKATAVGDSLIFEYSKDGSNWISVRRTKDDGITYGAAYTNGTTQVSAINSGGSSYSFDYFGYMPMTQIRTALVNHNNGESNMIVSVKNRTVTVANTSDFEVYSITGMKIKGVSNNNNRNSFNLQSGIYIVKSGSGVQKIIVE